MKSASKKSMRHGTRWYGSAVAGGVLATLIVFLGSHDARALCMPMPTVNNDNITCSGAPAAPDQNLGDGDDTLTTIGVTTINNDIRGGNGNDTITIDTGGTVLRRIQGQNNDDVITIRGTVGEDVRGDAGNDTLIVDGGTIGQDLRGGTGNDIITIEGGGTVTRNVLGESGEDTISLIDGTVNQINAGNDNDTIIISGGTANLVRGGNQNDTITMTGGTVNGSIRGDGGNDIITLTGGSVGTVNGNGGADVITIDGATITNNILGGGGNDTLDLISLGGPVDVVDGGNANDLVILRSGVSMADITTSLSGGGSTDTLRFETLGSGTRTFTDFESAKISNFEHIDLFGGGTFVLQDTDGNAGSYIFNTGTGGGRTINLQDGTLQFANANTSIQTRTFNAAANTLVTGTGVINARFANLNGVVQPGRNSIGTLTFDDPNSPGSNRDVTFGASSITVIDLQGGVLANDRIIVGDTVTIAAGADLILNLLSGTLNVGDSFDIITSDGITGNFNLIVSPNAVVEGARWETNVVGGILQVLLVIDVPAPPTLILMLLGLSVMVWVRRRRLKRCA